ncbi:MAG: hypothetical protein KDK59_01375 [Simkania sp.]|nr:hypothetical protein [Simkania sp.]
MKIFRFLLLFCLPAFFLNPIPSYAFESKVYYLETGQELFIPRDEDGLINPWGYFDRRNIFTHLDGYIDHVFAFIDLLTDIDFLESLCDEEAERLIDFVIFIVRFSVPKSRPDLAEKYEQDISELLELMYGDEEYQLSSNYDTYWGFAPAVCYEKPEFILCKKHKEKGGILNQIKRKSKHFGHWCSKHRKPLIAGGVTIGVLAIGALTGGVGGSVAAAVGGALAGAAAMDDVPRYINKPGEVYFYGDPTRYPPPPTYSILQNDHATTPSSRGFQSSEVSASTPVSESSSSLEEIPLVMQEGIEEIRESFTEEPNEKKAKIKEFISYMGHQILDELETYGLEHVVGKDMIDTGHEVIDRAFGTDYAADYTTEVKQQIAALKDAFELDMATGELPPPATTGGAIAKTGAAIGSAVVAQEALVETVLKEKTLTKADTTISNRYIDPRLPKNPNDLLSDPNWMETSHPKAREKGHREFKNIETGEILRFDEGKPGMSGHKGKSHWHRLNPNSVNGDKDKYLNAQDQPVSKDNPESHLYPKEQ